MEGIVRSVRSYKKTPIIAIPETPDYFKCLLPSASSSSLLSSPKDLEESSPTASDAQKLAYKFERMEVLLKDSGFDSVGEFLKILFYNPSRISGESDPRGAFNVGTTGVFHAKAVSQFLQGQNKIKMSDIIVLIYRHKHSAPSPASPLYSERHAPFSPSVSPVEIFHACPSLFSWATNLVATHVHEEIYQLSRTNIPDSETHLRASTNGRRPDHVKLVTWQALGKFSISALCEKYRACAPVSWHITESMAASPKNGVFIAQKRCPHPIVQVGAISSFILSRNRFANGDLAMALGVWHFTAKSHIDVKRVYSQFGNIVSDNTMRNALDSMTGSSLSILRDSVRAATGRGETEWCLILDNVQEYCPVYEGGIARESILKVGTAATAKTHLSRVAQMERKKMTVETLRADIDWHHLRNVQMLHWVRVLVDYVPDLNFLSSQISARFRSPPIAKHRMREGRKTVVQPLGTNAEREIETQGMARALLDFNEQMGLGPEAATELLSWVHGDGASYATILRLQKYVCHIPDNHKSFRNRIATPEIWHAKATKINSIVANHYGPVTSKDPSSLSRSSNAAGFKRPTNLSSCDFYPTVRSMSLIWEAQYFSRLNLTCFHTSLIWQKNNELPTLNALLLQVGILVDRYASQDAYEQALSKAESIGAPAPMKVAFGPLWTGSTHSASSVETNVEVNENENNSPPLPTENLPTVHQETDKFDGDRVLARANSILFLQDFGWWTELAYAVPEGDIGRVFEILKVWIFTFAGSSHQNYMTYLLEMYCLLRYEASNDLRDGILNNWLVNVTGELGKWIEGDLLQEHYNRWLEDMVKKRGGDSDDKFYRQTLSPNVEHFLRIKEEIENAFDLKIRGKTHTSPHLRDELRLLLSLYSEENLHLFCAGRTFIRKTTCHGYNKLRNGKLKDFIYKTTTYADVIADIQAYKKTEESSAPDFEDEDLNQQDYQPNDDDPPPSEISGSESYDSKSASGTSSSGARSQEGLDEADPSNDHLVSGSDYSMCISENRLTHEAWYNENRHDNSSDEEDEAHEFDGGLVAEGENGSEDNDLYNSDYASE
ncbi:hypothetical protein BDZ97DRAFT_1902760 [Flammula alnicola]|nr:hypothetical protein BDZ97DRAFT_1902760 [Flammula alnicola]